MSVLRDIVYLSYFYYFAYITYWYAYSLVSELPILCVVLHVSLNSRNVYSSNHCRGYNLWFCSTFLF